MTGTRRLRLMFIYLVAAMAFVGAFNFLINPFGIWPVSVVPHIYAKASRGRVSPAYSAAIQQQVDVALVGTSRTRNGFRIASLCRDGVLNSAIPSASVVETAEMAEKLSQREDLRLMIWELSFCTFGQASSDQAEALAIKRIRGSLPLTVSETVFSSAAVKASCDLLQRWSRGLQDEEAWALPWTPVQIRQEIDRNRARFQEDTFGVEVNVRGFLRQFKRFRPLPNRMRLVAETIRKVRDRGIEIILFVPPVTEYHLEVIRQGGNWDVFQEWKRQLVKLAPLWDFCAYNEMSRQLYLFRDANHFHPISGWAIYRRILDLDCEGIGPVGELILRSGVLLTQDNVETELQKQTQAMQARLDKPSRFRDRVIKMEEWALPGRRHP